MPNPGSILYPANPAAFQVAKPVDYPTLSNPFPRINVPYVLEQRFQMWGNSWTALALGTDYTDTSNFSTADQWSDYAGYKLVNESPRTSINGGFVEWTRTFAKIPDRFEEPMTATYGFIAFYPGFATITDGVLDNGREGFSAAVDAICVYDFAEVEDLADLSAFPIISAQAYGFKSSNPPFTPYADTSTTPQIWVAGRVANVNTNPTLEEYLDWVNETGSGNPAIAALGGTPAFQDAYKYWMVAEDSTRETWLGLIVMRKTILIRPQ